MEDRQQQAGKGVVLQQVGVFQEAQEEVAFLKQKISQGLQIAFLIGGAAGLSPEVLMRSERQLSLSEMTLPHELARVLLVEQLYRAASILHGGKYHR